MGKVLLVEDDPRMIRMYRRAFSLAGYEIKVAQNGLEGLEKVKEFPADIILLDIMMPKMDGMQVLAELKKNPDTADIPVVMLTNIVSGTLQSAKDAVKKGAVKYIIKSDFDPDEVVQDIGNIIDKRNKTKGD